MKQQLFSTAAALLTASTLFGQLPVSQTQENRNVVLEEFTGIYCTYCPDGHKRAQDIKDANPGDVVLVNVHTGGYAQPNGSDPDFRTPFGTALANQSGLQGYPSGTVNREVFTGSNTALGRGDWATYSSNVLNETSYANIALESTIDVATRELTVDVEIYYTADGPAANNLNVALLQSGIEGPQTGMAANPDQVLPNGNYQHNHMLRHFLTGQWGEVISTTTQGTLETRQYVYTIPADLNGVSYELGDLEVVAYIAEGNQYIISGAEGPIDYIIPPGSTLADLEASTSMSSPSDYCSDQVTPEITVTNQESDAINSYEVSYMLNGGTAVTQTVNTPLAPGASTTTTFPSITLPAGENVINYEVNVISGSSYVELVTGNNTAASSTMYIIPSAAFGTTNDEGFENVPGYPDAPAVPNTLVENADGHPFHVISQANVNGLTHDLGGFGNSTKSLFWNFFGIEAGGEASLVFHKLDFSTGSDYGVTFNHAYAQYSAENDKLEVLVSTDCGATWTTVHSEEGSNLATASPATSNFWPAVTEWRSNYVDLSSYEGESEVMVAFKGTSGYGNNLFVDDINISDGLVANLNKEVSPLADMKVYPNPTSNVVNVEFELTNTNDVSVSILNTVGQTVTSNNLGNVSGVQSTQLDVSSLESGMYIVKVQTANGEQTKRISVIK
ncbi:Omp28-related outer membrane protein [Brumimicrobium aurantiacum]|uniref:T9SS C-terminal target domain-containing protein n=1 Tax=Brumimicrobium aurantiacum TaxID=1737063 RepID=A0A3E1F288_9FLAO|nr:Omp28-related outer membrane protein [Brumimicrobium aurantiacum]RFC55938.1 T9SS C-terminal target domain-containing protein [Brumimicrobium aurantiacum]